MQCVGKLGFLSGVCNGRMAERGLGLGLRQRLPQAKTAALDTIKSLSAVALWSAFRPAARKTWAQLPAAEVVHRAVHGGA